jgi:hypothetical protein
LLDDVRKFMCNQPSSLLRCGSEPIRTKHNVVSNRVGVGYGSLDLFASLLRGQSAKQEGELQMPGKRIFLKEDIRTPAFLP